MPGTPNPTAMLIIPPGRYHQGSHASPDEKPVREIQIDGFEIDQDPVTNELFARFINDGGYQKATLWTPGGWDFIHSHAISTPNYWNDALWADPAVPVTGISWWEAMAFARWEGKTLPTEAQWEYSCRGPSGNTYPWGDEPPDPAFANYAPGGEPLERRPTPAVAYPRNLSGFGCRDLVGNFAEWCLDNYAIGYRPGPASNPCHLTDEQDDHVVRGGCGLHDEDYLRCAARDHYPPGLRDNLITFRCVRPLPALPAGHHTT